MAYSPLGHGWLVDDFPYQSPDDFAPDDFRRTGESERELLTLPGIRRTDPILSAKSPNFKAKTFTTTSALSTLSRLLPNARAAR